MENGVAKEIINESQSTLGQMEALRGIIPDSDIQEMINKGQAETTQQTVTQTPQNTQANQEVF